MLYKTVALGSVAALAGQATAFNSHRHLHQQRDIVVDLVTVWETVYVTEGADAATHTPIKPTKVGGEDVAKPPTTTTTTKTSTSTSTTTVVSTRPTTSSAAPPPPPPPPKTTTTSTPPKPVAPAAAVESAASSIASAAVPSVHPAADVAAPPAPAAGSLGFGKRGIAYNDPNLANKLSDASSAFEWAYDWSATPSGLNSKLKPVPMLWGPSPDHSNNWESIATTAISNGAKVVLSFNEPDNAGQSNMSPEAAIAAHTQFMGPLNGKVQVTSPCVTNSNNAGEGVDWLKSFVQGCESTQGCEIQLCCTHWYSPVEQGDTLFSHIQDISKACNGKPVMLTEFAPSGPDDQIADFLKTAIPKLDAMPEVAAYSYFMAKTQSLFNADGSALSVYGDVYANI